MVVLVLGDLFWYGVGVVLVVVLFVGEWWVFLVLGVFLLVVVWLGWVL